MTKAQTVLLVTGFVLAPANLAGFLIGAWSILPIGLLGYLYLRVRFYRKVE